MCDSAMKVSDVSFIEQIDSMFQLPDDSPDSVQRVAQGGRKKGSCEALGKAWDFRGHQVISSQLQRHVWGNACNTSPCQSAKMQRHQSACIHQASCVHLCTLLQPVPDMRFFFLFGKTAQKQTKRIPERHAGSHDKRLSQQQSQLPVMARQGSPPRQQVQQPLVL